MNVDLTIRGRVETLHLEDGDKIIVTIDGHISAERLEDILNAVRNNFPGHEVICLNGLSIARAKA